MLELSKRVPYSFVKNIVKKSPLELRVLRLQSIFFGASGLLPSLDDKFDEETGKYVFSLHSEWQKYGNGIKPMAKSEWVFKGIRPHNYPTRRLAGISIYLNQKKDSGLFQSALNQIVQMNEQSENSIKKLASQIQCSLFQTGEGYFANRSNFGSKKFSRKVALIGEDRSLTIWVNTFLPLLVAWAREQNQNQIEEKLHQCWKEVPVNNQNHISKIMLGRLLGSKIDSIPVKKEQIQQGLIQIFQDFCDTKLSGCTGCPFPRLMSLTASDLMR
jgi:hypothetical protein